MFVSYRRTLTQFDKIFDALRDELCNALDDQLCNFRRKTRRKMQLNAKKTRLSPIAFVVPLVMDCTASIEFVIVVVKIRTILRTISDSDSKFS
jgi:hypothetical protein